ncbi:E3 ubiquitin-protein ligase [Canna indica]|uniref:E3 ubiquitin-protein ligase n=1 Tax=Canna indica TaxID=4628 RepID=A0AAQ3JN67_9LILI|nr:E3 ubiquitin-protein ligase [Canna indica]
MAGMLPGVECARRRRLGSSTDSAAGSRRSSFCLYTTGHDQLQLRRSSSMQRIVSNKEIHDESLGHTAREAKERLDARLRSKRNSGSSEGCGQGEAHSRVLGKAQREVFAAKKSGRKFSWSKMGWEASEKADCAVCLEDFEAGDDLVHLPCDHRFHWNCVLPWLESSPHCPCCRMTIFS